MAGALGAEIGGAGLSQYLSDDSIAQISQALPKVRETRQGRIKMGAKVKPGTVLTATHPVVRTHPETVINPSRIKRTL